MVIFETISKLGKKIRLTDVQWIHILRKHKELDRQTQKMKRTLLTPDVVYYCPKEENYQYYKYFRQPPVTEKYLMVVVKHLNDEGFIITAFFISKGKMRKAGKEVVYGPEDLH